MEADTAFSAITTHNQFDSAKKKHLENGWKLVSYLL